MYDEHGEADHILDGIQKELQSDGHTGVVLSYAIVVSWVDDDGEQRIMGSAMQDQRAHMTLGLLEFGTTVERDRIRREWASPE